MRKDLRDDRGQLMMLAGIVITIAFILTALTFSQVSSMEKQAASEGPSPIIAEWRFLHERLASNFRTAVGTETDITDFTTDVMPTVLATFRAIEAEKGYDLLMRLAADPVYDPNESDLLNLAGTNYDATSADGSATYADTFDGLADGLIHDDPCPDTSDTDACLSGVYVYVRLTDGTAVMEETILFALNQ